MVYGNQFLNEDIYTNIISDSYKEIKSQNIQFNGKNANIKIKTDNPKSKLMKKVPSIIKLINSISLYNYLYNLDIDAYKNIDSIEGYDKYFGAKKVESGKDLMNSIDINNKISCIYINSERNCIYFSGEFYEDYVLDYKYSDQHKEGGFSIVFPNGEFIKGKPGDKKLDSNYKPIITYMGQYRVAL